MTKSVVRFSLIGMLLGTIVSPAFAHYGNPVLTHKARTATAIQTEGLPTLIADGPSPIPWPKTPTKPPAITGGLPTLMADGPSPIPWPKPTTPTKPLASVGGLV